MVKLFFESTRYAHSLLCVGYLLTIIVGKLLFKVFPFCKEVIGKLEEWLKSH